ncbi:hypothetical protein HY488_01075 [Candidatus Woesearchaeota archaeon]|nr:hypothetical protein [Candidatus Woesearchaeota archaeon]
MRQFHSLTLTVFCKPDEEDEALVKQKLKAFFPFDLEKEKVPIAVQRAAGLDNKQIHVLNVTLTKEAHLTQFFNTLLQRLNEEQKKALVREAESRLDVELCFYIRFDKERWNDHEELWIVDHGNCYHCKIHVAAYPKKREVALKIILELFGK